MVPGTNSDDTVSELNVDELRLLRSVLHEQEDRVSYWRRLIQARIDIMETVRATESAVPLTSGPDLRRILTSPTTRFPESDPHELQFPLPRSVRSSHLRLQSMDTPDDFSDGTSGAVSRWNAAQILALWERVVDPTDLSAISTVLADLNEVEAELSAQRTALLGRLKAATTALIDRYATDPSQALSALPRIW
jgi:hypothetical protein